jgi:hypothetical protein
MAQSIDRQISYRCIKCGSLIHTTKKYLTGSICFSCKSKREKVDIAAVSADIHNLVKRLNRRPSLEDYVKEGKYPLDIVYKVFKSQEWEEILSTLGYKTPKVSYTRERIVEEIERITKKLSKFPTVEEYSEISKIDVGIVKTTLKAVNWVEILAIVFNMPSNVVEQAINPNHSHYKEQLNKLKTIANKLRRTPTIGEAIKYGVNVEMMMKRLNKKWEDLLVLAQIENDEQATNNISVASVASVTSVASKEQMLENLQYVAKNLGYYPSELKYDLLGSYSSATLKYQFDKSWVAIIDLAKSYGFDALTNQSILKEKSSLNKTIVEFLGVSGGKK